MLDYAQENPGTAPAMLRAVMLAVRLRLANVTVVYPVPNRLSLKQSLAMLDGFLAERTGGLRLQVVTVALFRCVGERFALFTLVRSNDINAADVATGSAADLECVDDDGSVVMAVEVKDRQLKLLDIQDKLPAVRQKGIRELPFLIRSGIEAADVQAAGDLVDREFVTGQNIYVVEFKAFLESCLLLFGESGRTDFIRRVGEELDERRADIGHRRKWAELLANV